MQTTLVFILSTGLVSSLLRGVESRDIDKRFILSFVSDTCADVLPNCADYGQNACTDSQYAAWAKENCQKTCNMCPSGGGGGVPTPPSPGGGSTGCADKLNNCAQYQADSCTTYKSWATENCAKTCNLCSSSMSAGSPSLNSGGSSGSGMTGTSTGCVYNSQVYQQGQTWKDACKYKCECVDGTSGKYQCRSLCLTWSLPDTCRMDPPAPGKCCPKPVCPPSIKLQYPPGYTEE
ncbi:CCN family member 3-like isoform X2 [Ruditapes philippinarum]|uniref:CCN family member 3-like isoform X2 n=1 Tax=Ruditapes philippinarum TaxID=129788 RepID=UPI00295BC1E4|nr:CCN family member 3-like isoform X2 [Ruditapes philippinarum]